MLIMATISTNYTKRIVVIYKVFCKLDMKKLTVFFILLIGRLTSAQAQDSITLYGIIDIGLQYATVNQSRNKTVESSQFFGIASGVQSGSRFGLRGTHEMGGGNCSNSGIVSGTTKSKHCFELSPTLSSKGDQFAYVTAVGNCGTIATT